MKEKLFILVEENMKKRHLSIFALGVSLFLFVFSLISDELYQTTTTQSNTLKAVLLIIIAVSAYVVFKGSTRKKTSFDSGVDIHPAQKPLIMPVQESLNTDATSEYSSVRLAKEDIKEEDVIFQKDSIENSKEEKEEVTSEYVHSSLLLLQDELLEKGSQERSRKQKEFFETQEGEYGNGNTFLGVNIADIVKLSEKYHEQLTQDDIHVLLDSSVHDERIVGIWTLINKYKHAEDDEKKSLYNFYLTNRQLVNNWDLVDLAARNIIGEHIKHDQIEMNISHMLVKSDSIWDKRTAIMSAHPLVLSGEVGYAFSVIESLIDNRDELVQSATGWVLKEAYKQNPESTELFIKSHFFSLSKQAIRIGTERMDNTYRKAFLRGEFEPVTV